MLHLASKLSNRCHAKNDYISKKLNLYSFLLTLSTGLDDTNSNSIHLPPQAQDDMDVLYRDKQGNSVRMYLMDSLNIEQL